MRLFNWLIVIIVCLFVLQSSAFSERLVGHDLIGLHSKEFNTKPVCKFYPKGTPISILDWTFGTETTNSDILLSCVSPSHYIIDILNTVCVRNGNCGKYEPLYGYSVNSLNKALEAGNTKIIYHVKERVLVYKALSIKYPSTEFAISPALEHNLTKKAYRVLADAVLSAWPEVQLVNSPMKTLSAESYRGAWIERHGSDPWKSEISSLDGTDVNLIRVQKWLQTTEGNIITFVWSLSYNCRVNGAFQDPRSRTSCPKAYMIEELVHVTDKRVKLGSISNLNCQIRGLMDNAEIWKQFADDHGTGDSRANLPVFIGLLAPGKSIQVLASNGKEVGSLGYYGKYEGNLNRYYSGYIGGSSENGYTWEKEATALTGFPQVYLKQGKTCVGPIVAGRRNGKEYQGLE